MSATPRYRIERDGPPLPHALNLTFFDSCAESVAKRWIIKGVLAFGERSSWVAPPGSGKSALLEDIAVHAAARRDWRGYRAKEAVGVVVFALERADLWKRRLLAYQLRDEIHGLPVAIAGGVIDMLSPSCVDIMVQTVQAAERQMSVRVGLLIIDTWSKGIAAGGGDEDKAKDQNRAAANLERVQEKLTVHIASIGHTGKDESRGERGSNARLGDVDMLVKISGDTIKTATIEKANDGPEGPLTSFQLQVYETGRDDDGDPITVAVISSDTFDDVPTAGHPNRARLSPKNEAALRALHECMADGSAPRPNDEHVPQGVTGVTLDAWRDRLQMLSIITPKEAAKGNPREEFRRIHVTLKNAGVIGIWDNFVWPVTSRHIPSQ